MLDERVIILKEEETLKTRTLPAAIKDHAKMLIKLCFI
jgi:hypothetical protein